MVTPEHTRYERALHTAIPSRSGANYKKWQLKQMSPVGKFAVSTEYHDPEGFMMLLYNCKLRNHGTVAKKEKIHDSMNKTVCAWIEFERSTTLSRGLTFPRVLMEQTETKYTYNPRKHPHWTTANSDNEDNAVIPVMLVNKRDLYGLLTNK